jgi:protein TonB
MVAAHLQRFKQYPADARAAHQQGTGSVSFSISGSGGVTSVSMTRGTGIPSLDRELTAMVRRASPFPRPPNGASMSFSVPVNFRLQ